jgi:alpha-beta hydrolase superfamily lysophospholipase
MQHFRKCIGGYNMKHIEGRFAGYENVQLYYQSWHPEQPSQAVVILVHGLGGHSGVFQNVVDYLIPQGYEIYALDLRGHGHSPGQRGHINSWVEFREDLRAFLRQIRLQRACCPYILWGHSLGGTIALDYALRMLGETQGNQSEIQGLVVTAPALAKINIDPVKLAMGRLISKFVPRFSLKLGIHHSLGSRDPTAVSAYLQDPLRHEYGSARLATEFFATVDWICQHGAELKSPLLIMHGSADRVTLPEGSRAFFQRVLFADKEHWEYPGSYHDLYVDVDYDEIFTDLTTWLARHLVDVARCEPLLDFSFVNPS